MDAMLWLMLTVSGGRDGASALSDLRLLLNQPPRKLGGRHFFFLGLMLQMYLASPRLCRNCS
jgi:hypothetical protein